jgi:16S rRNA processing protein RimM
MSSTPISKVTSKKPAETQLRVGRLTKAHGLKGAIKLELFTDTPEQRFVPGAVFTLQVPTGSKWHGKTLELAELRWYNSHPVGFFVGINDRSEAETLIKAILWVNQDPEELPEEDDAWYDHQLVGLSALRDGLRVGTVARVDHLPAQDLLAIKTDSGEVLVPFVKAIVPAVDVAAGTVTLTPPLGLFEELADDEGAGAEDASDTVVEPVADAADDTSDAEEKADTQGSAETDPDSV